MIDVDQYAQWAEEKRIWTHPQFTVSDVCAITGATPKALEHFVDPKRELVRIIGNHANPGKGKRRIFTGGQVLMIKAAYVMNALGFPQRFSRTMADTIERRATGVVIQGDLTLITYPMKNGDWAVVPHYGDAPAPARLPVAVQLLDVDRLIAETKAQLMAIVDGEDIPNFDVPDIEPEPNPYGPVANFFRDWEKDDLGRWKYVGLTFDESEELLRLSGMRLNGDEIEHFDDSATRHDLELQDRRQALHDRHEIARLLLCGANFEEDDV